MQQTPPVGECPPRRKKQGRWVSGLKAECDFRGYLEKLGHDAIGWNGAVFLRCWRVVGRAGVAYLVAATVAAPYILCIMFLGLMLMAVKLA